MRKDKEKIIEMRKTGMSYRAIQKDTGVSRATLVSWFSNEEWSQHKKVTNNQHNYLISNERMLKMNTARKRSLDDFYALQEENAATEYELYKKDTLFWAGLMIYAGEGDKRTKHLIRISNSETYMHRIFIDFLQQYLSIGKETVKCALLLYPDLDETVCKAYWANTLSLSVEQFHKTHILQGKETIKRLQYGVGMTIMTNTGLKKKLLKWLELAQKETF